LKEETMSKAAAICRYAGIGLPAVFCALSAVVVWGVFYPALMSPDSIAQYEQALQGTYNDWHPPIMSIILAAVMRGGGGLGQLMLAQCIAGVFGLYSFVFSCLATFYSARLSMKAISWLALPPCLVLLSPISPLVLHLMTFWKDVWALVVLLWLATLALHLLARGAVLSRWAFAVRFFVMVLLTLLFCAVRHNAVVALPAFCFCARVVLMRRGFTTATASSIGLGIVVAAFSMKPAIARAFAVQRAPIEDAVMALDLVGLCVLNQEVCSEVPWLGDQLAEDRYRALYRFGDVGPLYFEEPLVFRSPLHAEHGRLKNAYVNALLSHPLLMAKVKLLAFGKLLGWTQTCYPFCLNVFPHPPGLSLNRRYKRVRTFLVDKISRCCDHRVWRWLFSVNIVWLLANLIWIGTATRSARSHPANSLGGLVFVLLFSLAYYASYLLVTTCWDFRFMYPSSLLVQALTLSWLSGGVAVYCASCIASRSRATTAVG
jgi:hypothetical protein